MSADRDWEERLEEATGQPSRTSRNPEQAPDGEQFSDADRTGHSLKATLAVIGLVVHTVVLVSGLIYLSALSAVFGSTLLTALSLIVFATVMGVIPAYVLYGHVTPSLYAGIAIIESIVIAIVSGVLAVIQHTVQQLQDVQEDLGTAGDALENGMPDTIPADGTGLSPIGGEIILSANIAFLLVLIPFNAPFLYRLYAEDQLSQRMMAPYLIPILAYLAIRFVFGGLLMPEYSM